MMNWLIIGILALALLFIGVKSSFLELYLGNSQDVIDKLAA